MISHSRREFLYKGFSGLALLSLPGHILARYARILGVDVHPMKELAEGVRGTLILPGDSEYEKYCAGFNKRHNHHPKVVALCADEDDVAHCVKWATKNQIPIRLKSGGHSYENLSSGSGIVIDLRQMNQIQVDPEKQTADIQSGARLKQVYEELWQYGLAIPAGSCPTVGIGGLTLGGGQGFLLRSQGLTSDHLTGVRMITASGNLLTADSDSHSDLLWACQGGGAASFGVITSLSFDRLLPVDQVTLFRLSWGKETLIDGFLAWQDWATQTSDQVSSIWSKGAMERTATCVGLFLGGEDEFKKLATPILRGAETQIWQTSFIEAMRFLGGPEGRILPSYFKTKSDYLVEKLNRGAFSRFLNELGSIPSGGEGWVVFESYGGVMDSIASSATAFVHRKGNLFCVEYTLSWQNPELSLQMLAWMRDFYQKIRPYFSGAAYANYRDLDLEDWGKAYFGENFDRLKKIKRSYDKDNLFQCEQGIPPAQA